MPWVRATWPWPRRRSICYYFELDDGQEKLLYYSDFFAHQRVDDRSEYYQLPFNHRADIAEVPEWAKDAVVYNIFPDSFATARRAISGEPSECVWKGQTTHGKLGGSIKGITENLDYIKNLGFNCIYINPIFAAGEYHKYDLLDYFHIDRSSLLHALLCRQSLPSDTGDFFKYTDESCGTG